MEMLHSVPFYRDVLFHAEYGDHDPLGPVQRGARRRPRPR
jgi:hypothetical protein